MRWLVFARAATNLNEAISKETHQHTTAQGDGTDAPDNTCTQISYAFQRPARTPDSNSTIHRPLRIVCEPSQVAARDHLTTLTPGPRPLPAPQNPCPRTADPVPAPFSRPRQIRFCRGLGSATWPDPAPARPQIASQAYPKKRFSAPPRNGFPGLIFQTGHFSN